VRILLTPMGSSGDVFPYLGIGARLQARGHEVIVITMAPFQSACEQLGLGFHPILTQADFTAITDHPDLWTLRKGLMVVMRALSQALPACYQALETLYQPGNTVLVGHTLSFATRAFEEKHQAPAVTLQLAPCVFRSLHQQPMMSPGSSMSHWPMWLKKLTLYAADMLLDYQLREVNHWRRQHGLAPVKRFFQDWIHSPNRVIGLFPEWFGEPQPDWPSQLRLTGFPLFDQVEGATLPDAVNTFLQAGDAPIVFAPGSANRQAADFFKAGLAATQQLGLRALLPTQYPEQLPDPLPEHALHVPFAAFSQLLPHCAAIVHHGGIGTCGQAFAAGIPQLIMPMAFDQPDNADRLQRLGVGDYLAPKHFQASPLAAKLQALLSSAEVAQACQTYQQQIQNSDAIERTCDLIEQAR